MYKHYKNKVARSAYMKIYNKKYREENQSKVKEYKKSYMKDYRKTHREALIENNRKWKIKNLPKIRKYEKDYRGSLIGRFSKYRNGAKARGYGFHLTIEEFEAILSKKCLYCDTKEKIGIDRANNSLGYIPSNCVPCCSTCNYLKGSKDIEYLRKCAKIYHILSKRKQR